jgi:hypothetical protein
MIEQWRQTCLGKRLGGKDDLSRDALAAFGKRRTHVTAFSEPFGRVVQNDRLESWTYEFG